MKEKVIKLYRAGGIAALLHSLAYLVGIIFYFTLLGPVLDAEPSVYLKMLPEYRDILYLWIFIAYWVSGFCLIIVIQAMHKRIRGDNQEEHMLNTSSVLGLIWAGLIIASGNLMLHNFLELSASPPDVSAWAALKNTENGITSGSEFIGGLWVFLASLVALKEKAFPRPLNILGILIGVAGILSIIPPLNEGGSMFFGIVMIIWFFWLGVVLLMIRNTD